jgi:replicative DNA helicase Mcm
MVKCTVLSDNMDESLVIDAKNFFKSYKEGIAEAVRKGSKLVSVDFNQLREFSLPLSENLCTQPEEIIKILERAINEEGFLKEPHVVIVNFDYYVPIHHLRAKHIHNLVSIKGIIKRVTKVIPRVVSIGYQCQTCSGIMYIPQDRRKKIEPTRCSCGTKAPNLKIQKVSEEIKNIQELNLEESQDDLDGKQPQQLRVYLEEELTDGTLTNKLQPGKRVEIVGEIKKLPVFMTQDDSDSNLSEFMLHANNIISPEVEDELFITDEDMTQIQEIAANNPLKRLSESLVPEVYGNDLVKRAICLQCVKGVAKEKSDGTHSREDINILLCGDVGVAKSVTLKATMARTPKAKMVVGTKTSKVGLGAMAVKDELTNSWSLEVGALVLANGSVLCIDELDKMYKEHLSELLEPMSASTVTINKAGISATLPARTSILASANPILGNYDLKKPLAQQIDLPAPILNRFDLIFILLDRPNVKFDAAAVSHIFKGYKEKMTPEIPIELFKKYILHCRKLKPKLNDALVNYVQDFYVELRERSKANGVNTIPVNLRNMEAVVKLAEAHAKLRLSETVEVEDLDVAKEIFLDCVKTIMTDDDTGVIDQSMISSKVPLSKRGKMEVFFEILNSLADNSETGEILFGQIKDEALAKGMREYEINMFLDGLIRETKIFEPRRGVFKLIQTR